MADTKISALTALTGANATISTDVLAVVDTSVTTTKKMLLDELGIAINLYKIGTFTRDMTAATGSVAYTGVGFKPKAVIFLCGVTGGSTWGSIGFTDGTSDVSWYNNHASSADSWVLNVANSIDGTTGSGAAQVTTTTSLDADGFTLSWTKIGSPTGTATVAYLALR